MVCSVGFSLVDTDYFKSNFSVLARVALLVGTSSHTLKCGFDSWLWHTPGLGTGQAPQFGCGRDNQSIFLSDMDVSLPLFLPLFPSLSK